MELELEELILALFADISTDRFQKAGIPEDRYPTLPCILSHVRECIDSEKFGNWVTGFIELESPLDSEGGSLTVLQRDKPT